jgi:predicted alpha/beta-hydrolase family hydrolase
MNANDAVVEAFEAVAPGQPAVRGLLHRPARPSGDGLVLTHGAGGNRDAPVLATLAIALAARGLAVLRCDLPYRQERPKGPPPAAGAARDREGLRQAVLALRRLASARLHLGGLSYGGRQASMLAAAEPGLADGLLLLSYPLHPPGRPSELRTAHFRALRTPALFVHGSADPFGSIEEIEAARALISAATTLVVVEGGHDLGFSRPTRRAPDLTDRIVAAFLGLVG